MAKIEPLGDRVVIKPIPKEEVSKGGIVLPDTAKEKPQEGEIIAVGPGRLSEKGERIAMEVKKGDRVIYSKYAGTEFKLDDEELVIMREGDILARKFAQGAKQKKSQK
jgi:chaperonin GroES